MTLAAPPDHHDDRDLGAADRAPRCTTIIRMVGEIQEDVKGIRRLLEDENGEEETEDREPDA